MKFQKEFNVLVIPGFWNNAIFNNAWVSKFLLPQKTLNVEIPINGNGSMRISTENFRLFTIENRLVITLINPTTEAFEEIGNLIFKIAEYLPHTPVSSYGFNFNFTSEKVEKLEKEFVEIDEDNLEELKLQLVKSQVTKNYKDEDGSDINILIVKENDNKFDIQVNLHFNITNLIDLVGKLETPQKVESYKYKSVEILRNLYNIELD